MYFLKEYRATFIWSHTRMPKIRYQSIYWLVAAAAAAAMEWAYIRNESHNRLRVAWPQKKGEDFLFAAERSPRPRLSRLKFMSLIAEMAGTVNSKLPKIASSWSRSHRRPLQRFTINHSFSRRHCVQSTQVTGPYIEPDQFSVSRRSFFYFFFVVRYTFCLNMVYRAQCDESQTQLFS